MLKNTYIPTHTLTHSLTHSLTHLLEGEEQGEVAVDSLGLQQLGGLNALPRRCQLDQDAVARDAAVLVPVDN